MKELLVGSASGAKKYGSTLVFGVAVGLHFIPRCGGTAGADVDSATAHQSRAGIHKHH